MRLKEASLECRGEARFSQSRQKHRIVLLITVIKRIQSPAMPLANALAQPAAGCLAVASFQPGGVSCALLTRGSCGAACCKRRATWVRNTL